MEQKNILSALFKFKKLLQPIIADAKNDHFDSWHLTLSGILETIKPYLEECELVILQEITYLDKEAYMVTKLVHVPSGEFISTALKLLPERPGYHALGSAITYSRRYSICTLLGITQYDDDGNINSVKEGKKDNIFS